MREEVIGAYNRGVAQLGEPETRPAAMAAFEDAIKLDPYFAHAFFGRAVCLFMSGRNEAAITDYDQAIALNPNVPAFYRGRAFSYLVLRGSGGAGDPHDRKAQADIAKADQLEGKKSPVWADTSSTIGGNADAMICDFLPQPITEPGGGAKAPGASKGGGAKGKTPGKGDRRRAEALYEKALECMESGGLKKEALRLLKEAIAADPTYPNAYDGLADVFTSMGHADRAAAAMRKCGELKAKEKAKNKKWWQFWK
jgi:tetratricopeptide (TPR) repeat protein